MVQCNLRHKKILTPSYPVPSHPPPILHISAASLSLSLADDSQERSLYTGFRPLAYNALVVGRDRNKRLDGGENGVKEIGGDILGGGSAGGKSSSSTTTSSSTSSAPLAVKKGNQPSCRIYKVDLTGNFYRCQAGATGIMWEKAEEWMRTRGAKLAGGRNPSVSRGNIVRQGESPRALQGGRDSTYSSNNNTDSSTDSTDSSTDSTVNSTDSTDNSTDSTDGSSSSSGKTQDAFGIKRNLEVQDLRDENTLKVEIEVEKEAEAQKVAEVEGEVEEEGEGEVEGEGESDMSLCLTIAQCCIKEVYGVCSLSNVTVQVATVQGDRLWG
jgi:hypothetical protein